MVSSFGRRCSWAAASFCIGATVALMPPAGARAQGWDDEVIADPELDGEPTVAGGTSGEEVIEDPELAGTEGAGSTDNYGWGDSVPDGQGAAATQEVEEYDPTANTGLAKLEVAVQTGFDLYHEGDERTETALEDAYETRFRFGGEIEFRRSRTLRIAMGTRIDLLWAIPSQNDAYVVANNLTALDQDRFELDIIPTAAYVDWTMFDGGHLRIGAQQLTFGRMNLMSGTDILTVYDMRPQASINPAGVSLAQPAVRFDWDITQTLTLQLAYVPWFMPNLMRPDRDKYKTTAIAGMGTAAIQDRSGRVIDPSFQTQSNSATMRFVGPAPDFTTPQGLAKLTLRRPRAIVSLTGGAALQKVPSFYYRPELEKVLICDPSTMASTCSADESDAGMLMQQGVRLFDAEYHRYYLVGGDLSFDLGPVNVALEAAFSPKRYLYAATADGSRLPVPDTTEPISGIDAEGATITEMGPNGETLYPSNLLDESIRAGVPVVQGGLHAEYILGQSLIVGAEAFWIQALRQPHDTSRWWLGFNKQLAAMYGGGLMVSYVVAQGSLRFDLSAVTMNGPSLGVIPRIEYRITEGLFVDVSMQLIEGIGNGGNPGINGSMDLYFGGVYGGSDQVLFGLRWLI